MLPIAVVCRSSDIDFPFLVRAVSAVQAQVTQQLVPVWNTPAAITPYQSLAEALKFAPLHSAFVYVTKDPNANGGLHTKKDANSPPEAVVKYTDDTLWTMTLSHEIIEMLVDPAGNWFLPGPDPNNLQEQAWFLVEVCDPCQGNHVELTEYPGIYLSDFCWPTFYDIGNGSRYCQSKLITTAFSISDGGYMIWRDASQDWYQRSSLSGSENTLKIDPIDVKAGLGCGNLRGSLDRRDGNYAGPVMDKRKARSLHEAAKVSAISDQRESRKKRIRASLKRLGV